MFIRIVATPPGEAPREVREAWVGLDLPLAAGETGPRLVPASGVLSGPRTLLGKLFARLTGQTRQEWGYVVDAPQALMLLAAAAPWAARWWREHVPHAWEPGYRFVFYAAVCDEGGGATGRASARARGPAEGFIPSAHKDGTRPPTGATARERDANRNL